MTNVQNVQHVPLESYISRTCSHSNKLHRRDWAMPLHYLGFYLATFVGFIEIVNRIIFTEDFSDAAKKGFLDECTSCDFSTFSKSIPA